MEKVQSLSVPELNNISGDGIHPLGSLLLDVKNAEFDFQNITVEPLGVNLGEGQLIFRKYSENILAENYIGCLDNKIKECIARLIIDSVSHIKIKKIPGTIILDFKLNISKWDIVIICKAYRRRS